MSNKSPIFPMPEPHHFNDYGFDPQIHYFQVLQESRNHKKDTTIDSLQFNLQLPISKDDPCSKKTHHQKPKMKKKCWWRNAFLFFNRRKWSSNDDRALADIEPDGDRARAAKASRFSISGPIYMTETSRSGSTTPYRTMSRSSSGPLSGISTPYHSLRELNMEMEQQHRASTSSLPIYLVT